MSDKRTVQGIANVDVITDWSEIKQGNSPKDKPFLRVKFQDGTEVDMTLTLAEMIGGIAKGAQARFGYP